MFSLGKEIYRFEEKAEGLEEVRVIFICYLEKGTRNASVTPLQEHNSVTVRGRKDQAVNTVLAQEGSVQLCNIVFARSLGSSS